jgi:hypothetical protein
MFNADNTFGYTQSEIDLFNQALVILIGRTFPDEIRGNNSFMDDWADQSIKTMSERILADYDGGRKTLAELISRDYGACTGERWWNWS